MPNKLVILIRDDLKLTKGKMAAQAAHAAVDCALTADKKLLDEWLDEGAKKVVLKTADLKELLKYKELAKKAGLNHALITDAGHTQVPAGTTTVLGIGPDEEKRIDSITGNLKLIS
ncbi:MAG: peptidyl-tRNA hydrolase [Candidatus Aenigmarchaeota archaeon]|nr:peptidyl-tRNA hydrolase [Candidatus Aenigmarchaeota archaeon]